MALNVCKVTLAFQQHAYGWTENYFLPAPSSNLEAELAKAGTLATKRAPLSGSETSIPYVKVSNEQIARDVLVTGTTIVGHSAQPSDAPTTSLLCKRYGLNNSVISPLYMRGIWDAVVKEGGEFDFDNASWLTGFNSFRAYLTSAGFGFIGRTPGGTLKSALLSAVPNVDGRVVLTTLDAVFVGLPAGSRVKVFISGATGAASLNGPQVVTVSAGAVATTINRIPMFPYTGGGFLTVNTPQFHPITNVTRERIVERKVGRPLYLSVGRSKGRALA